MILDRPLVRLLQYNVIRAASLNCSGTVYSKSPMLLAYADDADIVGFNNRAVRAALSRLEKEAKELDIVVNEGNTKYLEARHKDSRVWGTRSRLAAINLEKVKTLYISEPA